MARKGLADLVLEAGTKLVARAADVVMNDPRGKDAVATAVGLAQRGKKRLEQAQEVLLKAAGVPGRQEYQDLAKQLARIKRKARELAERLDGPGAAPAADDGDDDRHDDPPSGGASGGRGTNGGGGARSR